MDTEYSSMDHLHPNAEVEHVSTNRESDNDMSNENEFLQKIRGQGPVGYQSVNQPLQIDDHHEGNVTLICFINFHSGGKTGRRVIRTVRKFLGDARVFDLSGGPDKHLLAFASTPNLRIAVSGGDGTINWVLGRIAALGLNPPPPVGFIPLGTGNDTSRTFGWGYRYPGSKKIRANLQRMLTAPIISFDRWAVTVVHNAPLTPEQAEQLPKAMAKRDDISPDMLGYGTPGDEQHNEEHPEYSYVVGEPFLTSDPTSRKLTIGREAQFNNYLSFGIDAQIQYLFHEDREAHRACYCSRICNMAWMGWFGAKNLFCCGARQLSARLEVRETPDGPWKKIELKPGLQSIVLLNTPTYAGGRSIWGRKPSSKGEYSGSQPNVHDGLLEILGTENMTHLTLMMAKARRAIRINQATEIRLHTQSPIHAQMDGEPWIEQPSTYYIRRAHQSTIIDGRPDTTVPL